RHHRSLLSCPRMSARATRSCGRIPSIPTINFARWVMKNPDALPARAKALNMHGLLAHWPEAVAGGWAAALIGWEEDERARRSLERRIQGARIGRFKPLCDFEWDWPTAIDRATFEALMTLEFLKDATNALQSARTASANPPWPAISPM